MRFAVRAIAILAALGFFAGSAGADNPKTYRITLSNPSKIGPHDFQPGEYKLVVDTHDPKVIFTHLRTGEDISLEAKVETGDQKYDSTAIRSTTESGVRRIIEIRIGGSNTRVAFE